MKAENLNASTDMTSSLFLERGSLCYGLAGPKGMVGGCLVGGGFVGFLYVDVGFGGGFFLGGWATFLSKK